MYLSQVTLRVRPLVQLQTETDEISAKSLDLFSPHAALTRLRVPALGYPLPSISLSAAPLSILSPIPFPSAAVTVCSSPPLRPARMPLHRAVRDLCVVAGI